MTAAAELKPGWRSATLGQLGVFSKGFGGSKEDEVESGVACVRYGDLYSTHDLWVRESRACISAERASAYASIQFGDVLFAASGETVDEIGKSAVNLIDRAVVAGGDLIVLRPRGGVDPRFLGYACEAAPARLQKSQMGKGVTVFHIYPSALRHLRIQIPSSEEQAAIVRYLDHVDERIQRLIAAKERLIELLEEEKQATINRAVTRGLDPDVPVKESGVDWLGEIPAHWDVMYLGHVVDLVTGFPFPSDGFSTDDRDIRLFRGVNISPGSTRWSDVVHWPREDRSSFAQFELAVGDLVLGLDRTLVQGGIRVATIRLADLPALLLQRVARIRARPRAEIEFICLLLEGRHFANYVEPIFSGISVPHLSPEQVRKFSVALPPHEEQRQILSSLVRSTGESDQAIGTAHRHITLLREYRTRLISDVVTGKLDVREAAAKLPQGPTTTTPCLREPLRRVTA